MSAIESVPVHKWRSDHIIIRCTAAVMSFRRTADVMIM